MYLLDANVLIEAKNRYYGFDFCPGFWDLIDRAGNDARLLSIEPVYEELRKGDDELKDWVTARKAFLFYPLDPAAIGELQRINDQVLNLEKPSSDTKHRFLNGADPFLLAYALAHGHTIVTNEASDDPAKTSKIKIPMIAGLLGIETVRAEGMMRGLGYRLTLE